MKFSTMGLSAQLVRAVEARGYSSPTPIQEGAIPAVLQGRDVLGGAQTGTGKTAAFALPVLHRLNETDARGKAPRALVLTPTRELANQVAESFADYGTYLNLKTVKIFGGVKINPQISAFRNGCDIVVATPGRLMDHMNQRTIDLSQIEILILDEADRMLDMGFIRDIEKIIKALPVKRQNLLFSATYSKEIRRLCDNLLKNPVSVEVTKRNSAAEQVEQIVHRTNRTQKRHLLSHLIKEQAWYRVLIFTRTKHGANRLCKQLGQSGIPSRAIHGNKSQSARNKAMDEFKKGDIQALVATDVAARGIHLEDLSHVVNFDLPTVPEDYIHRIGRTGRAGKSGLAISLVTPEDTNMLKRIQQLLKTDIRVDAVEGFVPVAEQTQAVSPRSASNGNSNGKKHSGGTHRRRTSGQNRRSSDRRQSRST